MNDYEDVDIVIPDSDRTFQTHNDNNNYQSFDPINLNIPEIDFADMLIQQGLNPADYIENYQKSEEDIEEDLEEQKKR